MSGLQWGDRVAFLFYEGIDVTLGHLHTLLGFLVA